ncbi:MAG: universal stress protein [Pseudomonadota bacterium]
MSYKSILTVLTNEKLMNAPLTALSALAATHDAHADAVCLGIDRTQVGYYYAGATAVLIEDSLNRAREEAEALAGLAEKNLAATGLRWGVDDAVASMMDTGRFVAHRARFTDLFVSPMPYGEDRGAEIELVLEAALFDGRTPVLVVPDAAPNDFAFRKVLVAWNESAEALSAIRKALPFLAAADLVQIAVIDPPAHGPERSDPGGLLSLMLSRHGVKCEIDVVRKTLPRISDVLHQKATDAGSDLIVMGAYGHSRLRQSILGGTTRNMLEQSKVPILMAH